MPIHKSDDGNRWVEMELVVPGTPEQVWHAIATGAGMGAWFIKAEVDERVGGALRFDFGPQGSSAGEVTAWEPPHRFAYIEREWSEGAPPVATEVTVTGRSGSRCVVRMVHSLFASTDDWDDQLEGFESGWPGFFEVLRVYLRHFAGERAAIVSAMAATNSPHLELWTRLTGALGLSGANVGEERSTPQQPEKLAGIVEHVHQDDKQRYLLLRLNAPGPGVALIGTCGTDQSASASLAIYLYGDDAEVRAAASGPRWEPWIDETFTRSQA